MDVIVMFSLYPGLRISVQYREIDLQYWFTNCAVEASAAQGPLRKWLLTKLNLLFFWQTEMMGKSICDNVFHMVLLMF